MKYMKYNTPKQRKKIYERILRYLENPKLIKRSDLNWSHPHICLMLKDLSGIYEIGGINKEVFPEFFAQRPSYNKDITDEWWKIDNIKSRINAMKKSIELCK